MPAHNFTVVFRWIVRLLYAVLLFMLGAYLWRNVSEIRRYDFDLDIPVFLVCVLVVALSYLFNALLWKKFAGIYAVNTPFMHAARAWYQSQLGKYIPGKVSLVLFRLNAYPQSLRTRVALASVYEYIASQAASCLIIFIALSLAPQALPAYIRIGALAGIAVCLVMLMPVFFVPVVNRAFRLIGHEPLENAPAYRHMLVFVSLYVVNLLLQSVGFYFVLAALTPMDINLAITAAGIYQAAALVGVFAFFAPAGIGVREGIMLLGLSLLAVPEPAAIVAVILMRLVTVAVELALAGVFTLLPAGPRQTT